MATPTAPPPGVARLIKRIDKALARLLDEVDAFTAGDIPRLLTLNIADLARARRALSACTPQAGAKPATAPAPAPEPPPPAKDRPIWEIRGETQDEPEEEWNFRFRQYNAECAAAEAAGLPPPLLVGSKYETEEGRADRLRVYDESIVWWHKRQEELAKSDIRYG